MAYKRTGTAFCYYQEADDISGIASVISNIVHFRKG